MPRVWRYPVPRGARPAPPTTPSNPAPRPQQQQHRSPRSPELQRSPATEFNENEIADGGLVAAPAGGGSRCRRRSCRRGPRARESMDKEEERGGQLGKARPPDRAFPIMFQMVEPRRDFEHRRSAASLGIGEAHAIEGVAK